MPRDLFAEQPQQTPQPRDLFAASSAIVAPEQVAKPEDDYQDDLSFKPSDFKKKAGSVGSDILGGLRDLLPDYRREEGEGHNLGNIDPGQIVGGLRDATQSIGNLGNAADNAVAKRLGYWPGIQFGNGEPGFQPGDLAPRIVNKVDVPENAQLPQVNRSEPVSYTHLTLPTIYSV